MISAIILRAFLFHEYMWKLPEKLIEKSVLIRGTIISIPIQKMHGKQFYFAVNQLNHQKISTHFLLTWYAHSPVIDIGQHWQLSVKLKPPIGLHNPGGFNYVDFLKEKNISATGYVQTQDVEKNKKIGIDKTEILAHDREKIQHIILASLDNKTIATFISALCVGMREGFTQSDWQVFQKTGTNHLVAVAGLHIGFVASAAYFLMNQLWRQFTQLMLWMPASRAAEIAALLSALSYATLSGFAIPAQRASLMLLCFMIAKILNKKISIAKRLWLAAGIVLFIDPNSIFDASFWLSFYSVVLLAWVMSGRMKKAQGVFAWLKMQGTIVLSIFPLTLLFFQQASLIAFFTNMIAIPWIGLLILPLCLISMLFFLFHLVFIGKKFIVLAGKLLWPLWKVLTAASQFPLSSWHHAIFTPWILLASVIGLIVLFAPPKWPHKSLGLIGVLPLFFSSASAPHQGDFWVSVIDVGQGLSVLVQTEHHVLLYDAGAHFPGGFDIGASVIAPYLRLRGISTIDRLEISHGDNDHSGGADAIASAFKVRSIYTSAPALIAHFHATACEAGQQWDWDGVHFNTLNPQKNADYTDNNSSCVLLISNRKNQILLTGDIQREVEFALLKKYQGALHATVLMVPHHGSRTSSSNAFLTTVSPQYAVISAGKYNRYHLPSTMIVNRYRAHHIILYNTADNGEIDIRFLADGQVKLRSVLK